MTSLFPAGQSYEIRMLDNRKIGELPEINGKLVKVSTMHLWHFLCCFPDPPPHVPPFLFSPPGHRAGVSLGGAHDALLFPPPFLRAFSGWCSMTDGCSTRSTSSWRAGAGTGLGTGSWT